MLMARTKAQKPGTEIQPDKAEPEAGWKFKSGDQSVPEPTAETETRPKSSGVAPVSWTASDFIAHDKSPGWYMTLAITTAIVAAITYLISKKDEISTGMVVVVGVFFGVMASRKPRELSYTVDDEGVQIGPKSYPYGLLRSFSVVQQEGIASIWLMPLKRFMPMLTIYYDPGDEQKIVDVLTQHLPEENHQPDSVDRLMHKVRF